MCVRDSSFSDHREFGYAEVRAHGHTKLLEGLEDFATAEAVSYTHLNSIDQFKDWIDGIPPARMLDVYKRQAYTADTVAAESPWARPGGAVTIDVSAGSAGFSAARSGRGRLSSASVSYTHLRRARRRCFP